MLRNLLVIAFRNIRKEKGYSFINILGLTLGITCSVFLFMYVQDETSYDKYHENAENIYRVVSNITEPDNEFTWAVAQIPLGRELRENHSEVLDAVRFFGLGRNLLSHEDKSFYEEELYLADSTAFDMFTYAFISGNEETALDQPFSLILTRSLAQKYFGTTDCIGKTLTDQDNDQFNITGVIEDVPLNSHFRFDGLISRNTYPEYQGSWGNFGVYTYIQFPKGYEPLEFQEKLGGILEEKVNPIFDPIGITIKYELQKITDIHLHSKIQDEAEAGGDISYVYIFSAIAFFVLIIASINYMNLATARSVRRAKEVGIRKVMGSSRKLLIQQFLAESIVLALLSLVLSLGLIYLLIPAFNSLTSKSLAFGILLNPESILFLLGIMIFIGLIAGSYPAFYLSRFNPVNVLKGKLSSKGGNGLFRKILVIFQFSISIFMLISTLVVYDQLRFLMNKDLGFDKDRVVRIGLSDQNLRQRYGVLRNTLLQSPDIVDVASSSSTPGNNVGKVIFAVESNEGEMLDKGVDFYNADHDFIKTLGMQIIDGRDFSRDVLSDTLQAVLVNEAMVERMSWDEPLGKRFEIGGRDTTYTKRVIGVVKDYHQNSLYDEIEPLMIQFRKDNRFAYVKFKGDLRNGIKEVEKAWYTVHPDVPFEFDFLDENFNAQYDADRSRGEVFTIFSGLTIIIACLGLLGLTSFTTEQRVKEIGIRKVVGAEVSNIVFLIAKDFMILVAIAIIVAFPFAYYFMNEWLTSFAYKIEMTSELPTFLLSALLAFIITIITVGYHTIRAATGNPVHAIRSE